MIHFPAAFIDQAMAAVRRELYANLSSGISYSEDHYLALALEFILSKFIIIRNKQSANVVMDQDGQEWLERTTILRDFSWMLRQNGYKFRYHNNDIQLTIGRKTYVFSGNCYRPGTLFGDDGDIKVSVLSRNLYMTRTIFDNPYLNMSSRAILRLMVDFAAAADSFGESMSESISKLYRYYRQSQIVAKSIAQYFETPNLASLQFRYGCRVNEEGIRILMWIYSDEWPTVKMNIPYHSFVDAPGYVFFVLKSICEDNSRYDENPQWASATDYEDCMSAPEYDTDLKYAGIF